MCTLVAQVLCPDLRSAVGASPGRQLSHWLWCANHFISKTKKLYRDMRTQRQGHIAKLRCLGPYAQTAGHERTLTAMVDSQRRGS